MTYDFTSIVDRKQTGAIKTCASIVVEDFKLPYYEDTISMWIADMDFACAPAILNRLKQRVDKQIFGYTTETDEYYESVIHWYQTRYQTTIDKSWIVYSNGTVNAIKNVIKAFTKEQDKVIVQSPVYHPFTREIRNANRVVWENALYKDENNVYHIDFDDFEVKCKEAKMFILCNPHNPMGNIWEKEEVQKLINIAKKNDVLVFSDEVHSDLIRTSESFTSAIQLENNDHVIVASAINKTFNLAGLAGTNLFIKNKSYQKQLMEYCGEVCMSPFTLDATIAAYEQSGEWVDELKEVLDDNLTYMDTFFKEKLPKIKYHVPQGTYLTWVDFNAYGLSEKDLLMKIAEEAHIILEGGSIFGKAGNGFVRLNAACPHCVLVEALERLYQVFK